MSNSKKTIKKVVPAKKAAPPKTVAPKKEETVENIEEETPTTNVEETQEETIEESTTDNVEETQEETIEESTFEISDAEKAAIEAGNDKTSTTEKITVGKIEVKPMEYTEKLPKTEIELTAETLMQKHSLKSIYKVGKFWFTRRDYAAKASSEKKLSLETFNL